MVLWQCRQVSQRLCATSTSADLVCRLTVWYSLYLILFSCPSRPEDLSSSDSRLCRPYLTTRSYVEPYVGPYYNQYADPYVQKVKPYASTANTRVIRPATVLAINNYNKYAAPQVEKARKYTVSEWERHGLPRLKKAQEVAQQAYDENLAVHVQKASEVASPYYETARENAFNVHEKHIVPAITSSQPHLHKTYLVAKKFTFERAVPFAQHAYSHAVIFVDGTLWPFVKKLYTDNIQPQVVMIGERIAKYQEGRKLQSAMERVDTPESSNLEQSTTSSTIHTESTSVASGTLEATVSATAPSSSAPSQPVVATDDKIQEDLVNWQKKFAVAADTGTDDLKERIDDIVLSLKSSGLGEGRGLANALEKTTEVELANVKAKINSVVSTLPENADATNLAAAEAEIATTIRHAGSQVRDKAQNVRVWTDTFKRTLHQRTEAAADLTLHILDDIRDLGLQEIGMRWAWMDGVTYRHWQKYHELKRRFAEWRAEVREKALSDPTIAEARQEAESLLEESMGVTETAAKELVRLRDVAKWKVAARDATDDFDTRAVPFMVAAISAASSATDNIKNAIIGTQGSVESLSSVASNQYASAADSASSLIIGTTGTVDSVLLAASSAAGELQESASSIVIGSTGSLDSLLVEASSTASSAASGTSASGSSALSEASSAAEDALSSASSIVVGTSTGSLESLSSAAVSAASAQYNSASSIISSATADPSEGLLSSMSSVADSVTSSGQAAISSASVSERLQQAFDDAGDKVADLTSSMLHSEL